MIPHQGDRALFWDSGNWRALCSACHAAKSATEHGKAIKRRPRVTIVTGPPGSGKSTYVQERAQPNDLIVDLDTLWSALSGCPIYVKSESLFPFVLEARDAVLARLQEPSTINHAWVIATAPRQQDRDRFQRRYPKSEVIILAVSAEECLRRIDADPRRANQRHLWEPIIRRWWDDYTEG